MSGLSNPLPIEKHRVAIKYCVPCDDGEQALRVTQELIHSYQHVISELVLEMSSGGVFEVKADNKLLFSKKALKRFPKPGEVLERFREMVGAETPVYPRG